MSDRTGSSHWWLSSNYGHEEEASSGLDLVSSRNQPLFFSTATILGATSKWESGQALAHGPWHLYATLRRLNCCSHCFIAVCCLHGNSQAAVAKKEECNASDGVGPAGCAPCSHKTTLLFHPDVDESQQRLHLMMFSTRSLFFFLMFTICFVRVCYIFLLVLYLATRALAQGHEKLRSLDKYCMSSAEALD